MSALPMIITIGETRSDACNRTRPTFTVNHPSFRAGPTSTSYATDLLRVRKQQHLNNPPHEVARG